MNRRGFISVLAGGAGAALVPWRGLIEPVIALPPPGGWVARSVADLWIDYANQVRPVGVAVSARVDTTLDTPWVVEEILTRGEVALTIAANIPPSLERQMRLALLKGPVTAWPTLGDFAPWEFSDHRGSYFVDVSGDVRRIDRLSRIC